MISKFVKEQKRYTREDLIGIFEATEATVVRIIKRLKEYGVLKTVRNNKTQLEMSDLLEEDVEVADEEDTEKKHLYVFTFVGIIIVEGRVLKCYPKYIFKTDEPSKELKQIVKVLQKYNSKEQIIRMYNDGGKSSSFNRLAAMVYLLNDYYENGVYTNDEQIVETNGNGDILWDRTVNCTYPIIQNRRPFYTELKTRKRVVNDYDFFKRLHESLLTACSNELMSSDLLDILDLSEVVLTDDGLSDLGDDDYLLYRLNGEMSVQFNTRKQNLLAVMESLISNRGSLEDIDGFSMYGTNSFNLVWEKVCAEVLNNKLNTTLDELQAEYGFVLNADYISERNKTLKDIIEKPKWTEYSDKGAISAEAKETLIPDLITLREVEGSIEFDIFDAKYYVIRFNSDSITGQPGIESIIKQYMYQLAYMDFTKVHNISKVTNCFLMPTEKNEVEFRGEVSMRMLFNLELQNIKVRLIPATMAYDYYISGKKMDIKILEL